MRSLEGVSFSPSLGIDGGELSANGPEVTKNWRERTPGPIFIESPTVITGNNILAGESAVWPEDEAGLIETLEPVRRQFFNGIYAGFEAGFKPNDNLTSYMLWQPGKKLPKEYHKEKRWVAFNPVYLGPMSSGLVEALVEPDIEKFKERLRATTPEVLPLSFTMAPEMGVRIAQPDFVNVVFIQDNFRIIDKLPADYRVALCRSFMAGLGSWKVDIATYSLDEKGNATLNNVTMGSLEGGHPSFGLDDLDELGWRHKIFACTNKVDVHSVPAAKDQPIPYEQWVSSPAVEGVRASGRILGAKGLLSDSVLMNKLVANEFLVEKLKGLARFSQQGEGALFAWDPVIGRLVVSCTGQMGAMKSALELNEVVAIRPLLPQERKKEEEKIGMIPVAGQGEPLKPSVEGPEFGFPMWGLLEDNPVWLNEREGGFVITADGEGAYKVPPIRAGGHLHRGVVPQNNSRVVHMETSVQEWPPVGCGVDASDEYSHFVFKRAVDLWEQSGRQIEFVTFPVHGHSTNYLQFYVEGKTNPANHAESLAEVLDSGQLKFTPDVPQVSQRIIPTIDKT